MLYIAEWVCMQYVQITNGGLILVVEATGKGTILSPAQELLGDACVSDYWTTPMARE